VGGIICNFEIFWSNNFEICAKLFMPLQFLIAQAADHKFTIARACCILHVDPNEEIYDHQSSVVLWITSFLGIISFFPHFYDSDVSECCAARGKQEGNGAREQNQPDTVWACILGICLT